MKKEKVGIIKENEPLSNHTTWKIGGPADVLLEPNSVEDLKHVMELIDRYQVPWRVIGRGSNLLVADGGIEGVVIKLGKGIDDLEIKDEVVRVGGGYPLIKLATVISREGLSGLEFAGGIPGSVGGAVFMNAGAHGSDISNILKEALVLFPRWTIRMDFSKRYGILLSNFSIAERRRDMCGGCFSIKAWGKRRDCQSYASK